MHVSVPGNFALGGTIGPNMTTSYVAGEDVSLVRGNHQISLGANLAHWRHNIVADAFSLGNWTFNGQATNAPLADFLLGKPSQLRQAANNSSRTSEWYLGLYAADAWKVTPRFTLSYGLRWEPGFPVTVRDGQIATFDEAKYASGVKTTVFKNAPFGISYPGDAGFPGVNCRSSGVCSANDTFTNWRQIASARGIRLGSDGKRSHID